MLVSIFCYLFDSKKFLSKYSHLNEDYFNNHACKKENQGISFRQLIKKYSNNKRNYFLKKWKHFIIVRHPIERFISGFTHICITGKDSQISRRTCFDCDGNIDCFVYKLYNELFMVLNKTKKYVDNHLRYHFFPQSWHCQYIPYQKYYKLIIYKNNNINTFYNELIYLFKEQNIPERQLNYISDEINKKKSFHSTQGLKEQIAISEVIYNNSNLIDLLTRIYYEDFINFNFSFPNKKQENI